MYGALPLHKCVLSQRSWHTLWHGHDCCLDICLVAECAAVLMSVKHVYGMLHVAAVWYTDVVWPGDWPGDHYYA